MSILKKEFWNFIDNRDLKELTRSVFRAAKNQFRYSVELNKSKRAELLFGENAGKKYLIKAQIRFQKRETNLQFAKYSVGNLLRNISENQKKQIGNFFAQDDFKKFIKYSENTINLRLLKSNMTVDNTKEAINHMNSTLGTLEKINSLDGLSSYLNKHLSDLIEKKMHNPGPNPFCVLGLIITSILVILIIIAALICAFTFGLVCEGVLDTLIDQVCSS